MGRSTRGVRSDTEVVGRDWARAERRSSKRSSHGWRVAATILLVVGIGHLGGALAAGGAHFFFPWFVLPLAFWFVAAGGYGRLGRARGDFGREPTMGGETPMRTLVDQERRLEAELAGARREVRELQAQLDWHSRLLKTQEQGQAGQSGQRS